MICHWFGESAFTILFDETGTVQGEKQMDLKLLPDI